MTLVLLGLIVLIGGGLVALALGRRPTAAIVIGAGSAIAGCLVGLAGIAVYALGGDASLALPWNTPLGGSFSVAVDGLSAFFLAVIFGLSAVSALYGAEYLAPWRGKKDLGASWLYFNVLVASMALVCLARNGLLFLLAWETMSLASYFLVTFEDERPEVRRAGWIYLVATHLGTSFLLVMFLLMAGEGGSLDFDQFVRGGAGPLASVLFVLAVLGFGTKAGFMPLHIWLPEAHPAAPSHVSALMSGVMIKTGIYGLVRIVALIGPPEPWWGWLLIGIGAASGVLGVLLAIAQHDLKRLLAYHSVENIGIIALGLGVGLLGWSMDQPVVAVLGLAGGLLHVANHAMFKGLLFFGAGAVRHATGTLEIDHLGGLQKKMPWTAATFLVASVAICGLPPLNGFVSEFLVYLGAYRSAVAAVPEAAVPAVAVIAALALIGGLAAACFAKAFGIVFLGEARSDHAAHAHEVGWPMRLAMLILAAGCVGVGLAGPLLLGAMGPAVSVVTGWPAERISDGLSGGTAPLLYVTVAAAAFFMLVGGLALLRRWLLAGRSVETGVTWDCGYVKPTARMQYTASSFAQPIVRMFRFVLAPRRKFVPPQGLLPRSTEFATQTPDFFSENVWGPGFASVSGLLSRVRGLQHGRVQIYVLYIVLTLLVLLVWGLR